MWFYGTFKQRKLDDTDIFVKVLIILIGVLYECPSLWLFFQSMRYLDLGLSGVFIAGEGLQRLINLSLHKVHFSKSHLFMINDMSSSLPHSLNIDNFPVFS